MINAVTPLFESTPTLVSLNVSNAEETISVFHNVPTFEATRYFTMESGSMSFTQLSVHFVLHSVGSFSKSH